MTKDINIKRRGLMFILSAPSGTGKTTLAKMLLNEDDHISLSTSCTTREKRQAEIEGKDYYFVDKEKFKLMVENNEFLEYAKIFDQFYGTPKKPVEDKLKNGEDVLFDIDWQGHRQLIATARTDVTSIFLLPPSKQELLFRLKARNQDNDAIIKHRMSRANEEIMHWYEYDYVIINKDLEHSLQKLLAILRAERLRKARRLGLPDFIGTLLKESFDLQKQKK